jgi:hypothetical protein
MPQTGVVPAGFRKWQDFAAKYRASHPGVTQQEVSKAYHTHYGTKASPKKHRKGGHKKSSGRKSPKHKKSSPHKSSPHSHAKSHHSHAKSHHKSHHHTHHSHLAGASASAGARSGSDWE